MARQRVLHGHHVLGRDPRVRVLALPQLAGRALPTVRLWFVTSVPSSSVTGPNLADCKRTGRRIASWQHAATHDGASCSWAGLRLTHARLSERAAAAPGWRAAVVSASLAGSPSRARRRDERSAAMRALDNMDPETLKRILSDVRSLICLTRFDKASFP